PANRQQRPRPAPDRRQGVHHLREGRAARVGFGLSGRGHAGPFCAPTLTYRPAATFAGIRANSEAFFHLYEDRMGAGCHAGVTTATYQPRIAAAAPTTAATSIRIVRGPRRVMAAPASAAAARSGPVHPPSGPTRILR